MKFLKYCLICSVLAVLMVSTGFVSAKNPVDEEFDADVSWSESDGLQISLKSVRESSTDLPLKSAEIEGELSSPDERTIKFEGELTGVVSESGMEYLSEKEVMGQSLVDLLPLAQGLPELVEEAVFDAWENRSVGKISLARSGMEMLLPHLPDKLPGLKLRSFDLSELAWDDGRLGLKLGAELVRTGYRISGPDKVRVSGRLRREGGETVKEVEFTFAPRGGNWDFVVPYAPAVYGMDRSGLEESLRNTRVEVSLGSAKVGVGKVPEGYRRKNSTYVWGGGDGDRALASLITGEGDYSVKVPETEGNQEGGSGSGGNHAFFLVVGVLGLVVLSIPVVWYLAHGG
ncbi:hypothetical protein AKJ41_02545 [candidate division MSBL1 archaeon SCGC-AAA259O05]|uniref:Uncharacterized protein n=1 Tax=candidate division MSBL1 archaeon SCGC-AAA259O05 TaxID=1698271 RepID=A0A133V3X8_9EURY|nr:hypothetical protein AKJ41_02545 [candidate division MSBL1 archaeon SCGC-AAA259O05]